MQKTEIDASLRDRVWRSLPTITLVLSGLYVFFTVSHSLLLQPPIRQPMVVIAGSAAIAFLGIATMAKRFQSSRRFARPLAFLVLVLLSINSATHLHLTGDIVQSTNIMLIILGASFILLSTTWYVVTLVATLLAWGAAVSPLTADPLFTHFAFAMATTTLTSIVFYVIHIRDLVENHRLRIESERQRTEMEHLATHDSLTNLPNRRKFMERLAQEFATLKRHGRKIGVLYIDLNDFKSMNDVHGHKFGDKVLVEVGCILSDSVRETDVVARLGGDEFALLMTELENPSDIRLIADKIHDRFREPKHVLGISTTIKLSIGMAVMPDDTDGLEELLRLADMRMYDQKRSTKQ
ncbi:diguanylate cyclase domain-containing protein [Congregibacter sp.]|uniref:diguanylate cyclase domain-containing protein n=1 Tax=Congregibacter sp. TaxID=2744308 RepID=UPI00385935C5